jgi:hypothetical protein
VVDIVGRPVTGAVGITAIAAAAARFDRYVHPASSPPAGASSDDGCRSLTTVQPAGQWAHHQRRHLGYLDIHQFLVG